MRQCCDISNDPHEAMFEGYFVRNRAICRCLRDKVEFGFLMKCELNEFRFTTGFN